MIKGVDHDLVLDTMKNGKFFFKNTREDKKPVEIPVDAKGAPNEFFFVHIKLTNMAFACVSMLQFSCVVFIRQCLEQGLIDNKTTNELEQYIMQEEIKPEIRKLLTTVLSLDLQETISKVRFNFKSLKIYL